MNTHREEEEENGTGAAAKKKAYFREYYRKRMADPVRHDEYCKKQRMVMNARRAVQKRKMEHYDVLLKAFQARESNIENII